MNRHSALTLFYLSPWSVEGWPLVLDISNFEIQKVCHEYEGNRIILPRALLVLKKARIVKRNEVSHSMNAFNWGFRRESVQWCDFSVDEAKGEKGRKQNSWANRVLAFIPPEAEPEIRICMPGLHLGSEENPRRESGSEGREEGKTAKRVCTLNLWLPGGRMGEGIVREFGINMYPLLYLKWIITRTYCIAQGTLLNVTWQPGWEGSFGENGYMYMYGWIPLLSTWNYHNIVNWLYSNIRQKVKKKKKCIPNSATTVGNWSLDLLGNHQPV